LRKYRRASPKDSILANRLKELESSQKHQHILTESNDKQLAEQLKSSESTLEGRRAIKITNEVHADDDDVQISTEKYSPKTANHFESNDSQESAKRVVTDTNYFSFQGNKYSGRVKNSPPES